MSPPSKKKKAAENALFIRHFGVEKAIQTDEIQKKSISSQTNYSMGRERNKVDAETQTTDYFSTHKSLSDEFDFSHVSTLIDTLIDSVEDWNSIALRIFSVMIYLILRLCKIKFDVARDILKQLNLLGNIDLIY